MNVEHLTGLLVGKLERWLTTFVKMLPNLAIASVVIVIGWFIAKLVRKLSYKLTLRISHSDSISGVVSGILQVLVFFITMTVALGVMNLEKTVSSLLAGVGIVGLALGFAFQDLSSNFISGLFMAFKRPFEVGDQVETNAFIGTIHDIRLRDTTLFTTEGLHVIIPNKDIFQKPIINYSRSDNRRVELDFTVATTTDLEFAESVIRDAIQKTNSDAHISEIEFYYTGIEDPKVKLTVSFRIDDANPSAFMQQRHLAIRAILKAFGEHQIIKMTPHEVSA